MLMLLYEFYICDIIRWISHRWSSGEFGFYSFGIMPPPRASIHSLPVHSIPLSRRNYSNFSVFLLSDRQKYTRRSSSQRTLEEVHIATLIVCFTNFGDCGGTRVAILVWSRAFERESPPPTSKLHTKLVSPEQRSLPKNLCKKLQFASESQFGIASERETRPESDEKLRNNFRHRWLMEHSSRQKL
jgi:hypothetical protein